jgi:hypothetical protein
VDDRRSRRAARLVMGVGRGLWRALPAHLRDRLEHRFFYAVFNVTRVTNDHYGWRPGEPTPPPQEPG